MGRQFSGTCRDRGFDVGEEGARYRSVDRGPGLVEEVY